MTKNQTPASDEPTTAKKEKKQRKGPQRHSAKRDALIEAVTKGNTIAEASRIAGYNSRHAGHRALTSMYASAPELMVRMNITPDKWLAKLAMIAGILEPPANATPAQKVGHLRRQVRAQKKEQYIKTTAFENGRIVRLYDPNIVTNACNLLNKAFYGNEPGTTEDRPAAHTVCLVVANDKEAAEIARLLAPSGAPGVVIDVDAQVDQNVG